MRPAFTIVAVVTLVEHWRGQSYEASEEEQLGMVAGSLRDWILGPWQARLLLLLGAPRWH